MYIVHMVMHIGICNALEVHIGVYNALEMHIGEYTAYRMHVNANGCNKMFIGDYIRGCYIGELASLYQGSI